MAGFVLSLLQLSFSLVRPSFFCVCVFRTYECGAPPANCYYLFLRCWRRMHIFPLRLCILLAAWTRVLVSATDVFWWFELRVDTAAKVNQCVDFINTHRNVVQGVYVFVDGSVDVNGNWIAPDPANVSATIGPILSTGVEVGLAVNLAPQDGSVMMSGNAPKAAAPMASWLSSINGATRLMLDYEPTAQITDQHRQNYAAVLSAFSQAAHGVGKQVDTCVGGSDFWRDLTTTFQCGRKRESTGCSRWA